MSYLQKRFYLFNCDNTYNLQIVETFLLEVEEKYGFKFSVDRRYFGLLRMAEVCDRIIPTLDMDVNVFVVNEISSLYQRRQRWDWLRENLSNFA